MSSEKIVTLFVESGVLIRITNSREDADYCITSREGNEKDVDNIDIKEYLLNNEISLNSYGFNYLVMAITIVCEKLESKKKYSLSKHVYPVIAEKFSVTTYSVERAIWNAILRSLGKGIGAKRFIEKYKLGM